MPSADAPERNGVHNLFRAAERELLAVLHFGMFKRGCFEVSDSNIVSAELRRIVVAREDAVFQR
jgi:hypothetical protein